MFTKAQVRSNMALNQKWLERGILALDARQTADEKASDETIHDNDQGWNAADAKFGGYLANYIRRCRRPEGQRLSGRFVGEAREMMRKYAGQLARIANANMEAAALKMVA